MSEVVPLPLQRDERLDEVSIVMPAYNEEANIARAVAHATAVAERLFRRHEIVVVDDGSRDRTADIVAELAAADPRIRLLRHERNRGYGEAIRTGLRAATLDLVFLTDADNQFDLGELERFLPHIARADVVVGYRVQRRDPWLRRVLAKGWNILVRVLFHVPVRDIDCAFKLFRRSALQRLEIESVGAMVSTEMMVKLGRTGSAVVELGVTHLPRTAGRARGAHPAVILQALRELVRMRRRLRHLDASTAIDPAVPR